VLFSEILNGSFSDNDGSFPGVQWFILGFFRREMVFFEVQVVLLKV
jgi:hypothetical protein